MKWETKSPGIDLTDINGFRVTRISERQQPTGRIDCKGKQIMEPVYNYIAIKITPPLVRYTSTDFDRIKKYIFEYSQLSIFS